MSHERLLDELIKAKGVDGAINLLADRIQAGLQNVEGTELVRRADRVEELRGITRTAAEVLMTM